MRKRVVSLLLAAALCFCACACTAAPSSEDTEDGGLLVVASFYPVWLIADEIVRGVPGITLERMADTKTGCLHDYQLTMSDMRLLDRADLFLMCGGLEPFADDLRVSFTDLAVCEAAAGLSKLVDGGEENAHLWMSVDGACGMADGIAAALSELDPVHETEFRDAAERFRADAEALKAELAESLSVIEKRNVEIFGEAFAYFAEDYGFRVVGAIAVDEGEEPAVSALNEAIGAAKANDAVLLWTDSQYSDSIASTVAADTGATVVSLGALTGNESGSWFEQMRADAEALLEAWETVSVSD